MSEQQPPRRAYVFEIKIGADSRDDLIGVFRQLEYELYTSQLTEGVSGGYSSGYTYKLDVDESITHDTFVTNLNAWLEARKQAAPPESEVTP